MATILPSRKIDYSNLQRAIAGIGQSIDQRQAEDRDRNFRLYLLDQEYKKRIQSGKETADYQAQLENKAQAGALEYQSDMDAAIQSTIEEAFMSRQAPSTMAKPDNTKQMATDTDTSVSRQTSTRASTLTQLNTYDPEELVPINRQGQTIYYKKKELLQKGLSGGFWDPEEHRVVTYEEQQNKKNIELLGKQILSEIALEQERKRSGAAEKARINLLQAQTEAAKFNLKVSRPDTVLSANFPTRSPAELHLR